MDAPSVAGTNVGKPRTITGRVAHRMVDALGQIFHVNFTDFEYVLMLGAAQATHQGLTPDDFDNERGIDAFSAIFGMFTKQDERGLIYVTPEWRRVVISARRLTPRRNGERSWRWRASGNAQSVTYALIPPSSASSS